MTEKIKNLNDLHKARKKYKLRPSPFRELSVDDLQEQRALNEQALRILKKDKGLPVGGDPVFKK